MDSRAFSLVVLLLIAGRLCYAAVPTNFAPLNDSSSVVWSVTSLNKGDVVEVHAFKAAPGTVVFLGMCNDQCERVHVLKNIPVYRPPANSVSEKYTLEEGGHLVFWTAQPPRQEINAGASRAISDDSQNQVAQTIHSGVSAVSNGAAVMEIRKSEIDADQVKVRFDGGCYVTLSRISTASP